MANRFIPGIASQSLGHPQHHKIHDKLKAAVNAELRAVEIFFEDIENLSFAWQADPSMLEPRFQPSFSKSSLQEFSREQLIQLSCASQIRQWCVEVFPASPSLDIICLQPFMHFEGLLDPEERRTRFEKLYFWIEVAKRLGTDLIQIPSNFLPESQCTGERARIVADLRAVALIGAAQEPPIRFAHEALCWGTHSNTWDAVWEIVDDVGMPNFGTCLDTFNIAGRVYADPARPDGKNQLADEDLAWSIQKLRDTFKDPAKLAKVFYVELCDGERLEAPLAEEHEWYNPEQPARMTWSRNARLYPFETDSAEAAAQKRGVGYLPVVEIFNALLDVGYEGYISFEVFNRSLNQPGWQVIDDHAARVKQSWIRCAKHIDEHFAQQARPQVGNSIRESSVAGSPVTSEPYFPTAVTPVVSVSSRL